MAIKAVVSETCDLCRDGKLFPEGRTKALSFAFRGVAYDLDLCNDHFREVAEFFAILVQAGQDRRFDLERRRRALAGEAADARERVSDWVLGSGLPRLNPDREDVLEAYKIAESSLK